MGWEQLKAIGEVSSHNILKQEVEEHMKMLEKLKAKATPSAYNFTSKSVDGLILDIKAVQAAFRRKAADNNLLDHEAFIEDAQELVSWYLSCYNRLDKLKPKGAIKVEEPSTGSETSTIGKIMSDTLIALQNTLKNTHLNNNTNPNLKRPHFEGGENCFAEFESYMKSFNIWTRKVTDKVKLFQLLRNKLSGPA